jgi:NADH:ubiquinone oxidoreductase 49 kD subunit 7
LRRASDDAHVSIGGTQYELYEGFEDQVRTFIKDFPKKVDEYETLLTQNRIWIGRTRGVGAITAKAAIDIGLTGPALARFRSELGYSQSKTLCGLFRI